MLMTARQEIGVSGEVVAGGGEFVPPVQRLLDDLHARYLALADGHVATYIPELSKADPEWFGLAVATLDGHVYSTGDCGIPFTIQSISKPFVYGLALEDHGWDVVLERVGLEPTGDAFNAISLDPLTGRPANPMINAGAIATTGLIKGGAEGAMTRILQMFSRYAGRALDIDEEVFESERSTGHRNRAISHLLRNFDHMPSDPEAALENYFRQCSIRITCRDLAVMAATLSNGGVNPITGERALDARYVDSVLSVMKTCGMYNYAGEWTYRVGMPAKSGVAGGVIAALVGQIGIGVYSPRLDPRGNSERGVRVCNDLSREHSLHMLNVPNVARSAVRASYDLTGVRSKRSRTPAANRFIGQQGRSIRVYELQGHLNFAAVEAISREVGSHRESRLLVFDFKRVLRADPGAGSLLDKLFRDLATLERRAILSDVERVPGLIQRLPVLATPSAPALAENCDRAIEWCEDRLLEVVGLQSDPIYVPIEQNEFFAGLNPDQVEALIHRCTGASARAGDRLPTMRDGERYLLLFVRGHASVVLDLGDGEHVRLATNPPGSAYGEMFLVGGGEGAAVVMADTDLEYQELSLTAVHEIAGRDPAAMLAIIRNVAVDLAESFRAATAEIHALCA
jgi:glutaminase